MVEKQTYDELLKEYQDGNEKSRGATLIGFGMIDDPRAFNFILECLNDPNFTHFWQAAWALSGLSEKGLVDQTALEPLLFLLGRPEWQSQSFAAAALGELIERGILDERAVEPLKKMIYNGNPLVKDTALGVLTQLSMRGIRQTEIIEILIRALSEKVVWLRGKAASHLGVLATGGLAAKEALIPLCQIIKSKENKEIQGEAIHAIACYAEVGFVDRMSIALLKEKLHDKSKVEVWYCDRNEKIETTISEEAERALGKIQSYTSWEI